MRAVSLADSYITMSCMAPAFCLLCFGSLPHGSWAHAKCDKQRLELECGGMCKQAMHANTVSLSVLTAAHVQALSRSDPV